MFEVYKEKLEITGKNGNKEVYEISPLSGEYLEDLYSVMEAFQGAGDDEKEILKVLGTSVVNKLHNLVLATLLQSYPNEDKAKLNQFVSQNLMKFIEPIIKVNMPSAE
jgi:DNA-binding ferritin-like protein (Dps family)